jgi:hypothetical protein
MHDELLPQPPLGVPVPAPGEVVRKSRHKFWWIIFLGLGTVVFLEFATPFFVSDSRRRTHIVTAVKNAKQIGLALFEFESQYGEYPDASTALAVKSQTGSTWALGDATSNDLFQQLFVAGICEPEEMFYAKTPWSKKPDKIQSSEADTLAANECGFAYIVGLSSKDDPATPICVTPLEPGKLTFDREPFDSRAVILRVDQSAISLPIDPSGRAILNGMDLFDPRQPFWHGKAPTVKWPK